MTIIHNHRLEEEIDLTINSHIQGQIRTDVNTRYQDLEKLLSSNLGDKLKGVCEMQSKPSIPRPNKSHNVSMNGVSKPPMISQFQILPHHNIDHEISMFTSNEKAHTKNNGQANRSMERPRS